MNIVIKFYQFPVHSHTPGWKLLNYRTKWKLMKAHLRHPWYFKTTHQLVATGLKLILFVVTQLWVATYALGTTELEHNKFDYVKEMALNNEHMAKAIYLLASYKNQTLQLNFSQILFLICNGIIGIFDFVLSSLMSWHQHQSISSLWLIVTNSCKILC